jgi:diadenosine tetraphosphate (Ap4A) HIT family hydrolase
VTPGDLYYLGNCRTDAQRADMLALSAAGICVFCPEHLSVDPDQPTLHRTALWTVTPNEFPYAGTLRHLLLVPDEHVPDLLDLSPRAQAEFWPVLRWVRDEYGLAYYGLGARNGDCRYTGGTVHHVHVHVIVGDPDAPEPVRLKLSSGGRPR